MRRETTLDWLSDAACASAVGLDPRFFPEDPRGKSKAVKLQIKRDTAAAKALCDGVPVVVAGADGEAVVKWGRRPCPVRDQCLKLAMVNEGVAPAKDRSGIFGGKTPAQRADLARELEIAAKAPNETRRRGCPNPGTALGASKHFLAAEPYCGECEGHAIDEVTAQAVRRMVEHGVTNAEIFKKTTADSAFVRVIRIALGIPDPGRRMDVSGRGSRRAGEPRVRDRIDEVKVERFLAGERIILTRAERLEVIKAAHAQGLTDAAISRRFGIHPRAVYRDRHETLGLPPVVVPTIAAECGSVFKDRRIA